AWCGHRLYTTVLQDVEGILGLVVRGALVSGLLFLIFSLYEFRPPQKWKSLVVILLWLAISIGEYEIPAKLVAAHLVQIGAIHGFYKSRLVRAYLGASNTRRGGATEADITDAVPEDDLLLVDMKNTRQGAPYHLINTTLNLVGGQDLATQQRFSDSFVMSKLYCGSIRTGYRKTGEYACGTISLGTAVAVSGAAVSP